MPVCGKKMGVLALGVASDRLTVACAKAHKGGDANAKVVPCDPRIYTNNSNHSSSTKKKTQKHHKIRKTTSNRQQEA